MFIDFRADIPSYPQSNSPGCGWVPQSSKTTGADRRLASWLLAYTGADGRLASWWLAYIEADRKLASWWLAYAEADGRLASWWLADTEADGSLTGWLITCLADSWGLGVLRKSMSKDGPFSLWQGFEEILLPVVWQPLYALMPPVPL